MNERKNHDARIAPMRFSSVYPHYVAKVTKKERSVEELHQVIRWLTGFDEPTLQEHIAGTSTFQQFFDDATLHKNATLITGTICGYRVEEIADPLVQRVRYLDKLVDELAKGRTLERILR